MTSTIRQKIILFTVVPVTVIYNLLFGINLYQSVQRSSQALENQMAETAWRYAGQFDNFLMESSQVARSIAGFIEISPRLDDAHLYRLVANSVSDNPMLVSASLIFLPDMRGPGQPLFAPTAWRNSGSVLFRDRGGDTDFRNRIDAWLNDKSYLRRQWCPPEQHPNHPQQVSTFLEPIYRDGQLRGMVALDVNLNQLNDVSSWKSSSEMDFMVVANDGSYIYVPYAIEQGETVFDTAKRLNHPDYMKFANIMTGSQSAKIRLKMGDEDHWLFYAPVRSAGWMLAASVPRSRALADLRAHAVTQAVILLISLVLIFGCVWFISGRISRPIRQLERAVRRVASGDLNASVHIPNRDETGSLARYFSEMTGQLALREEALRASKNFAIDSIVQGLKGRYFYFSHDRDGNITSASPSVTDVLGFTVEEYCQHFTAHQTNKKSNRTSLTITDQVLTTGQANGYEVEMFDSQGRRRYIEVFKVPMFEPDGSISGIEGLAHDITARVSDTEKFRGLLESAPDAMVITNIEGQILIVNERAETLFEQEWDDLIGQSVACLFPDHDQSGIFPLLTTPLELRATLKISRGREGACRRASGEEFPVEYTLSPLETWDGTLFSVSVRDITDRKQAEAALRLSEARFRRLVEGLQQEYFFYSLNPDGSYIYVTDSVQRILGYRPADFMKHSRDYLYDDNERTWVHENTRRVANGQIRPSYEVKIYCGNGAVSVLEVLEVPAFGSDGKVKAVEGIARDRTSYKKAEEELRRARDAAEAASHANSLFLSNMSHELRTPLNGVLGYTQVMLRDKQLNPQHRRSLVAIEDCGQHLLTLINDILDLAKIEAGGLEVITEPVDLYRLVLSVHQMLYQRAQNKGIQFKLNLGGQRINHVEFDPDSLETALPRMIWLDSTRLRQVLINLAGNAIKYTRSGQVLLSVSLEHQGDNLGERLCFRVEDTGIGIDKDNLELIFEPFRQTDGGRQAGGTGLGLAISRRLVEIMGEQIRVESVLRTGSCFYFDLPLIRCSDEVQVLASGSPSDEGHCRKVLAPGQQVNVLVVDDNAVNRDILVTLLQSSGFTVRQAENGQVALDCAQQEAFDAILMDLRMPVMDGFDAANAIRSLEGTHAPAIIAVTASVYSELREKVHLHGFTDFVGKPFRADEIFDTLQKHLGLQYCSDCESSSALPDLPILTPDIATDFANALENAMEMGDIEAIRGLAHHYAAIPGIEAWGERLDTLCDSFAVGQLETLLMSLRRQARDVA
ncbi:MAG: hypothetical protein B0D91_12175 [Oceanospirillales bacterium LUC14_002_19_P2]|nr:MAG: hypothetical protein B0D91_12175 [Oceanospirillales bacterium LUC14_002_19_P2]